MTWARSGATTSTKTLGLLTSSLTSTGIMANALLLPVLPDLVRLFGKSATGGGVLLAVGTAPGIVAAPALGAVADRVGRRRVLLACLLVFAAGSVAMAAAPTWTVLLGARVVQGTGASALVGLAVVLIADRYEGAQLTRRLAVNAAALTAASGSAPVLSGFVGGRVGPQAPLLLGVVALPVAALTARVLGSDGAPRPRISTAPVRLLPTRSQGLVYLLGVVLFVIIYGPARTGVTFALADRYGMGPAQRGLVFLAVGVPSVAVSLTLARRPTLGGRFPVARAFAAFAGGLAAMAVAGRVSAFVAATAVTGAAAGLAVPVLQERVSRAAHPQRRGLLVTLWASGVRVGQAGGPYATGVVLDAASATLLFAGSSVVMAAMAVVATRMGSAGTST